MANSYLKKITTIFLILLFAPLQGCQTLQIRHYQTSSERPVEAVHFYERLDDMVTAEGAADASALAVRGFPYLRTNRFLIALKERLGNAEQRRSWIGQMRQLDITSRRKEILNLSDLSVKTLTEEFGLNAERQELFDLIDAYSERLLEHDQENDRFREILDLAVTDPGEYSLLLRTIGLYPLFTIPTKIGTNILYREFTDWHKTDLDKLDVLGSIVHYSPPPAKGIIREDINAILRQAQKDAFGFPVLEQEQIDTLLQYYAPVISQDQVGLYDYPGTVTWKDHKVVIDTQRPAVYTFMSRAFIDGQPAVQLNYSIWYEGRRGPNAPWLERGALDGLTMRITLEENGDPVMLDIMNNCGCYFMFIPGSKKIAGAVAETSGTPLLVPAWLPEDYPQKRLHVRVNSGWHQIQKVFTSKLSGTEQAYQILPYDILETLPHDDGRIESVFNRQGIMKSSFRIEPVIFFPAGIPRVGFMRQRGNHPIKLIGRAYFSDPNLYDHNFIYGE